MPRKAQPDGHVYEVLVTFKSGAKIEVYMTGPVFDDFCKGHLPNFFCPAPDYHKVLLRHESIDSAVIISTVFDAEAEGDDYECFTEEAQGPASTD